METKTCRVCHRTWPLSEFTVRRPETGARHSHCRSCQKARSRAHYMANRARIIKENRQRSDRTRVILRQMLANSLRDKACVVCQASKNLVYRHTAGYTGPLPGIVANRARSPEALLLAIDGCAPYCLKHARALGASSCDPVLPDFRYTPEKVRCDV